MLDVKEIRNKIVCLLRDYPVMCRKIALLRYEWEHPCEITESEMLNAMAYSQKRTGLRSPVGHVSDKTYHTAVNYRDQAAYCNREEAAEIEAELVRLEQKKYRLEYCVSQLPEEQGMVLRGLYFENMEQKGLVSKLNLSDSTIRRYRDKGLDALAEMYYTLIKAGAVIEW